MPEHTHQVFDVVVIGGGINGCGSAADAALRGLSVLLCEQDDLASKTSSSSSKLIHGGLRYLEYYDFGLVKKALNERQTLLELAPHLVQPLSIVLPYEKHMRPIWLLRAGLFIYDHLSRKNTLPNTQFIHRRSQPAFFSALSYHLKHGFLFYDATADDARLTIANAMQAKEHGATILTQTKLIGAIPIKQKWHLTLQSKTGVLTHVVAKSIINATGPWVESINQLLDIPVEYPLSLVKGSHIVVNKLYDGEHAYLLQHDDQRVVFVVPYHGYTMIGTTDVPFSGVLDNVSIERSEIDYLLALAARYFNKKLSPSDIINTWSGVRPLLSSAGKNASALSREYACHFSNKPAPVVTVYGGKITTYRQLSLEAVNQLKAVFPSMPDSKTNITPLPGAILNTGSLTDMSHIPRKSQSSAKPQRQNNQYSLKKYHHLARKKYDWLDVRILNRYLKDYGTRTEHILFNCNDTADLGICFTQTLFQAEVDYLLREEWASCSEDILWRRTKLGLIMGKEGLKMLSQYIDNYHIAT